MTPDQACQFEMPFGKYKGKTLEKIVTSDPAGAEYLDWMDGNKLTGEIKEALKVFLAIHWVVELVERSVEKRGGRVGRSEPVENLKKHKQWWER
jgi:uncharacterized protein (DUF3820 family)